MTKQQIADWVIKQIGGIPDNEEQLESALLWELTYEYGENSIKKENS